MSICQILISDPGKSIVEIAQVVGMSVEDCVGVVREISNDPQLLAAIKSRHPNNHRRYAAACQVEGDFWNRVFEGSFPLPLELELHPGLFCPFNCWYCCSPNEYAVSGDSLSRNSRVALYIRQAVGRLRTVQISGGREPLFDPDLHVVLSAARECSVELRLNTSGFTSVQRNRLHNIGQLFNYIGVSVDAPDQEVYRQVKNGPDRAYNQVLRDLSRFCSKKSSDTRVELVVLVLPENRDRLVSMIKLAQRTGVDGIRFRRLKDHVARVSNIGCKVQGNGPMSGILSEILDLQDSYASNGFSVSVNMEDFAIDYASYSRDSHSPCYSSSRKLVIDAGGDCYPCALTAYPRESFGRGECWHYHANIMAYDRIDDLWAACHRGVRTLHHQACSTCYVADRYLNNFIERLRNDLNAGLMLEEQPFGHF